MEILLLIFLAYGTVFLVRKKGGIDNNNLYAMKVLKKTNIVQKVKTAEHTKTERQVCYEFIHFINIFATCNATLLNWLILKI